MVGIYKITNPNNRIYIGQSTNIYLRWNKYKKLQCKDQPSLYSSLKKHSPENHIFEIIEECLIEQLDEKEIYWGMKFDVLSNKHLNNRLGRGFGSLDSEETKQKKRECHKGRSNYWFKGKKLTQEQRQKISKSKKGTTQNRTKTRKDKGIPRSSHILSVVKAKNKSVLQYDLKNNFIKEWASGALAAKELNINQPNINACCNNKINSYKGFIWKFKSN
jgi:group I intron endonuclease